MKHKQLENRQIKVMGRDCGEHLKSQLSTKLVHEIRLVLWKPIMELLAKSLEDNLENAIIRDIYNQ